MDVKLLDAIQNPFFTPFHPPELLENMALELNIFHMDLLDNYWKSMSWPIVPLDMKVFNLPTYYLRRPILQQALDYFNDTIVNDND